MPSRHEQVLGLDFFLFFSQPVVHALVGLCSSRMNAFCILEYSYFVLNLKPCLDLLKLMSECNFQSFHLIITNCQLVCGFNSSSSCNMLYQYRALYNLEFSGYLAAFLFCDQFTAKGKHKILFEVSSINSKKIF